jgi:hypothetical protein
MRRLTPFLALAVLAGCPADNERPAPAATTAASVAPTSSSSATVAATASAAPTASAEARVDPCDKRDLEAGSGTRDDMCKLADDVVTASYQSRIDDDGAKFRVHNPWPEKVTWLSVAVYYYDAAGKQLTATVDGKEQPATRVERDVVISGQGHLELALGLPKSDLPEGVDSAEARVLAFGWGGDEAAYFQSSTPFRPYRGIRGGDGPTGIQVCDNYRELLESCPKQFPDALVAMRKSLRQYNNAAPPIQAKLAESLASRCDKGAAAIRERCLAD